MVSHDEEVTEKIASNVKEEIAVKDVIAAPVISTSPMGAEQRNAGESITEEKASDKVLTTSTTEEIIESSGKVAASDSLSEIKEPKKEKGEKEDTVSDIKALLSTQNVKDPVNKVMKTITPKKLAPLKPIKSTKLAPLTKPLPSASATPELKSGTSIPTKEEKLVKTSKTETDQDSIILKNPKAEKKSSSKPKKIPSDDKNEKKTTSNKTASPQPKKQSPASSETSTSSSSPLLRRSKSKKYQVEEVKDSAESSSSTSQSGNVSTSNAKSSDPSSDKSVEKKDNENEMTLSTESPVKAHEDVQSTSCSASETSGKDEAQMSTEDEKQKSQDGKCDEIAKALESKCSLDASKSLYSEIYSSGLHAELGKVRWDSWDSVDEAIKATSTSSTGDRASDSQSTSDSNGSVGKRETNGIVAILFAVPWSPTSLYTAESLEKARQAGELSKIQMFIVNADMIIAKALELGIESPLPTMVVYSRGQLLRWRRPSKETSIRINSCVTRKNMNAILRGAFEATHNGRTVVSLGF